MTFPLAIAFIVIIVALFIIVSSTKIDDIITTSLSLVILFFGISVIKTGNNKLPVNGVCEIIYKTPDHDLWDAVITLPDGKNRFFVLDKEPPLGFVKVQPDYSLTPFPPVTMAPPKIESTETVIP